MVAPKRSVWEDMVLVNSFPNGTMAHGTIQDRLVAQEEPEPPNCFRDMINEKGCLNDWGASEYVISPIPISPIAISPTVYFSNSIFPTLNRTGY